MIHHKGVWSCWEDSTGKLDVQELGRDADKRGDKRGGLIDGLVRVTDLRGS